MAKRVVLFVLGGVLLVIGALAAIAGGALMALFGSNNTLSSGVQQVSTPTRALVSPADSIQGASGAQTVFGSVRLRIAATPTGAGHHLFPGIGPASAVDRYLSGSATMWPPTCLSRRFTRRWPATAAPLHHRRPDRSRSG
jgi:hypothetical protein